MATIFEDNEPAEFYKTLVVSEDNRSSGAVQRCLRAMAGYFKEKGGSIHVDGGYLSAEPWFNEYFISIALDYWDEEEHEAHEQKALAKELRQHGRSSLDPDALSREQSIPDKGLGMLFVRLHAGDCQDSVVQLLELASEELDKLGEHRILDLVFQAFHDENGVGHPYMRIYFRR